MNRKTRENVIGNIGVILVAMTLPLLIACTIAAIVDSKSLAHVLLFTSIVSPAIGTWFLIIANKLSK